MKVMGLTNRDVAVLLDDDDYRWLLRDGYSWSVQPNGYAVARIHNKLCYMHTLICKRYYGAIPYGIVVDHKNGNRLDNQKSNLQLVRKGTDAHRKPTVSKSGFRGVVKQTHQNGWTAQIGINGRCTYLGSYKTAKEAARVYDEAALSVHGDAAILNFPKISHESGPLFISSQEINSIRKEAEDLLKS